jgi:hypothetical protein
LLLGWPRASPIANARFDDCRRGPTAPLERTPGSPVSAWHADCSFSGTWQHAEKPFGRARLDTLTQGVTMNYRNTLIAAAVAALVPVAGTALANDQDKMTKSAATFDALDTNRDGRISRAEASADAHISFAQADSNGDGYLDNMEYSKARSMRSDESTGDSSTPPQPQSQSYPNDASGQQTEPVTPTDPSSTEPTTPPPDTETPRQ